MPPETNEQDPPGKPLLKINEVCALVGLSRATIYREVDSGVFPKPIHISARRRAWLTSEVMAWIQQRQEARAR